MTAERIERIKNALPGGTAALITNEADCFYFSGFLRSEGMVLITKSSATLYVDFRYIEAAKATCKEVSVKLTYAFLQSHERRDQMPPCGLFAEELGAARGPDCPKHHVCL